MYIYIYYNNYSIYENNNDGNNNADDNLIFLYNICWGFWVSNFKET